jgi:hypothetical protein
MNRIRFLVPLLGLCIFAACYRRWDAAQITPSPESPENVDRSVPAGFDIRDGRAEAETDLAAGILTLIDIEKQPSWVPELRDVMRDRYGVVIKHLPENQADRFLRRYAADYNDVMRAEIIKRHGANVYDLAAAEAVGRIRRR